MADTHFVIIHGLASKPPEDVLARRYRNYLIEGAGKDIPEERIQLVYWADLMGYEPDDPDRDEYVEGGDNFRGYTFLEQIAFAGRGLLRGGIVDVVEEKFQQTLMRPDLHSSAIGSVVAALPAHIAGGPARRLYDRFLPDLHRYFFDGRREGVQDRLREKLRAVPADSEICLIAHSMGSIIAADVIIADRPKIRNFITIGSPLGLKVIQEQIGATRTVKVELPSRIDRWFNLYDRLDVVALDSDLADDFDPMPILDLRIRNEFVNKDDERNHHKSYGYLRCPEMGEIVRELL